MFEQVDSRIVEPYLKKSIQYCQINESGCIHFLSPLLLISNHSTRSSILLFILLIYFLTSGDARTVDEISHQNVF